METFEERNKRMFKYPNPDSDMYRQIGFYNKYYPYNGDGEFSQAMHRIIKGISRTFEQDATATIMQMKEVEPQPKEFKEIYLDLLESSSNAQKDSLKKTTFEIMKAHINAKKNKDEKEYISK